MVNKEDDRRKHRRAYFSVNDDIIGHFILSGTTQINFNAPILNISKGGLHFTLNKTQGISPLAGDRIKIVTIKGEAALDFEFNSELLVEWILDHESVPHISCGCEFIDMSTPEQNQISEFIDSQYNGKTA